MLFRISGSYEPEGENVHMSDHGFCQEQLSYDTALQVCCEFLHQCV